MAGTNELTLKIEGMHCAGCVATIEKGVVGLPGVAECKVNLALASAKVRFDTGRTGESSIIQKIKELGYRAVPGTPDILASNENEITAALRRFLISAVLSVPLMILAMWPMVAHRHILAPARDEWLQAVLACLALFVAGRSIMADALQQLRHLRANMNSLIALGTLAAFGWSLYALIVLGSAAVHNLLYFDSAGMIITLILLGRYLEARARGKAGQAIKALLNLRPAQATAVINDVEVPVDVGSVKPGMLLMVRPGERIAADGEILESRPFVDESMLTGESVPIEKKAGDRVLGGSMNGNVPFTFRVTAAGEQSFLSSIIRLVSEAQSRKAPVQNLADRVAGVFVPIVIGIALLTLVAWLLLDRSNPMLIKSVISVLIIACPCALGLATPTAVLVGTGRAAREGIIVRGGDVLEGLTKVDAVIFDKTGTLTFGDLAVVDVRTFGKISKNDLLGMVGSAESRSEHPLAGAIVRFMHAERIEPMTITDLVAKPGFGLEARWNGHCLLVGNQSLMKAEGVDIAAAVSVAQQEMNKGFTVVFAALNGTLAGLISVADRLRP
ncbi:MAG TPA: heavy metal translocating P-type ATPase, partial [Candidatus Deferrimicrobium sp.]|nr:heavy metal translocating P-type ATPase [Candidatus Deferrimicrobium sp.]